MPLAVTAEDADLLQGITAFSYHSEVGDAQRRRKQISYRVLLASTYRRSAAAAITIITGQFFTQADEQRRRVCTRTASLAMIQQISGRSGYGFRRRNCAPLAAIAAISKRRF